MLHRTLAWALQAAVFAAFGCVSAQASSIGYQTSDAAAGDSLLIPDTRLVQPFARRGAGLLNTAWQARAAFYKPALIKEARAQFGINAPVALFAAQIHQESLWTPDARSKYANGLTQFTPATERWIKRKYPQGLGWGNSNNPRWAIRALVVYDKWLHGRIDALTDCDRFAMVLSAYNGGLGNLQKDKRLTLQRGQSPYRWWGGVENHSRRAKWAFKENRDYPRKIIYKHQLRYLTWGGRTICL